MSSRKIPYSALTHAIRAALAVSVLTVVACSPQEPPPALTESRDTASQVEPQTPPPAALGLGVDLSNMDTSVRPQDDFYRYVNGGWDDRTEIPGDRSRWGSFDELRETADERVLDIVRMAAAEREGSDAEQRKIADVYVSFMNEEAIAEQGLAPLQDELAAIDALSSHAELIAFWARVPSSGHSAPFAFSVGQDQQQSDQYITQLFQTGLGMPDREYYLSDAGNFPALRELYVEHISRLLTLAGVADAEAAAARILATETRIAEQQWTRVQNRDRTATYNRLSLAELAALAPQIDWTRYLQASGLPAIDTVIVRQPTYLTAIGELYQDVSLAAWQDYHRYHLLRASAPYLDADFVQAHFDFFGRELSGQPELRSRERRAVDTVESLLGFAVGRIYVDRHFQQESKDRMDALVQNLLAEFEVAIDALEWMSPATKQEAQDKLSRLNVKIAYPNEWRDYECLQTTPDSLLGNVINATQCEFERNIGRLGQPVNREEWSMTPQTVNAYYSPTMNEIVFPAGILQPPFFNVEADDAVNYGAIGAVIGHEITHGFDDQGRRSDGEGNLRDWWAPEDEEQFRARAQLMIDQFDGYEPIEGMNIQGALALGENIADLGGLTVSFQAWQRSLGGEPAPVISGFTGEQRFFLGYGQIWRTLYRDEAMRRQLTTGPHSPGMYRVRGTLSNMPEFYEAFGVQPGDGMYREESVRVKIW